jgi:primary-amine oxidase
MHPLDPLSADEIRQAVAAVRRERELPPTFRFACVTLEEPAKAWLEAWDGVEVVRRARIETWNRADGTAYTALVDLDAGTVARWEPRPGLQPSFTPDEYHECDEMLRVHPAVIEALARRGITDLSLVLFDVWAYGDALVPEQWRDRRVGWCDVWLRDSSNGNPYANFLRGLHLVVDMNALELLELEDDGTTDRPAVMGEYVPRLVPGLELRDDLMPLSVQQPDGVSFTLDGNEVRWQRWRMRIGFNYREGLVLHAVGYEDAGRLRPIAHRLSFAEMVVPYRDPTPDHYRRTAFDIGEWGLGQMTQSLELGCDCLGEIRYLDAVLPDSHGEPFCIRNAICLHEEDNAVLWKHVDPRTGAEVRRMRRLVVSFHVTVANYEYLVYWRFYQDGNIECEVRATGIMVTTGLGDQASSPFGTTVDERTYAPHHQHFVVARLDLDVDGASNTVVETHSEPMPTGPDNRYGVGLLTVATPLETESGGRRDYDWASQRTWKVTNPGRRNAYGAAVAYKLVPTGCVPMLLPEDSAILQRAGAIRHQLWVTAHHDDERWPCGEFPTQSSEDLGLPAWTAADRPIADTDLVLWYVFGIHHITRAEDWPVMPADVVSFWLKPFGFFDRNPALDVPPEKERCHGQHAH